MKDPFSVITHETDWEPITKVPSVKTKKYHQNIQKYGKCGVYLIATVDNLPKTYVDQGIVYIGMSGVVGDRLNAIRQPSGNHGCRTYIKNKKIDISTVYVKILYCATKEDAADLERYLHSQMEEKYDNRFMWKEASAGSDGTIVRILDAIDSINDKKELRQIYNHLLNRTSVVLLQDWKLGV